MEANKPKKTERSTRKNEKQHKAAESNQWHAIWIINQWTNLEFDSNQNTKRFDRNSQAARKFESANFERSLLCWKYANIQFEFVRRRWFEQFGEFARVGKFVADNELPTDWNRAAPNIEFVFADRILQKSPKDWSVSVISIELISLNKRIEWNRMIRTYVVWYVKERRTA